MARNLKALGLALLAAFALSAVVAPVASADDTFTSNSPTEATDLTGSTVSGVDPVLSSEGLGEVKCSEGTYASTVAGNEVNEIAIHPTYHGFEEYEGDCIFALLEENAKVDSHGCDYIVTGETDENGDAAVYIECTEGQSIAIETTELGITIDIPEQGPLTGVSYTGKSGTITVEATIEGIEYECTGSLCFLLENEGSGSDAVYTDDALISGFQDEGTFSLDSESHTWSGTHGEQVHLWMSGEGEPQTPQFHSEIGNTTLIAEQTGTEEMSFEAGSSECAESGYKGTMSGSTTATLTIAPEFASCEAFGFANTEVSTNGCAYVLHRGESPKSTEGSVDIECPSGKAIEVVAKNRGLLKCRVTIGAQTGLTTITETNKGSGSSRDIALDLGLGAVAYTQEAGEGLGKCKSGSFENGEISGEPTLIGENEVKEQVGIWAE